MQPTLLLSGDIGESGVFQRLNTRGPIVRVFTYRGRAGFFRVDIGR